jgi:CheY-like chemotaxis protein/HPt (histidine-containing phosphotransfer) domain-containing protein
MLTRLGHAADVAGDGEEALAAVAREAYDAVLMDCELPGMSGLEDTRRLRLREAEGSGVDAHGRRRLRLPVIAVTASALPADRVSCLDAGMDDFLSKPLRLEQLDDAVRRWISSGSSATSSGEDTPEPRLSLDRTLLDAIRSLEGVEPGLLAAVIDAYLGGAVQRIAGSNEAIACDDATTLARSAHALGSSSAQLGIASIADGCRRLEALGRVGTTKGACDVVTEIEALFRRLRPGAGEGAGASGAGHPPLRRDTASARRSGRLR